MLFRSVVASRVDDLMHGVVVASNADDLMHYVVLASRATINALCNGSHAVGQTI